MTSQCQINFCCCCYFLRVGCDWLKIFALLIIFNIFLCSLGASYKTFVILNSGNLNFWNFLSILRKFLPIKETSKALSCDFDDDNYHSSCVWYTENFFRIINDFVHRFILDRTFVNFTVSLLILTFYILDFNSKMVKSTVQP
jgi:hypothetical protein